MTKYLYIINQNLFQQEESQDHTDGINLLDNFFIGFLIYKF